MQQFCHRCAAALPLRGRPMQWCPRCGGVLSAPTTTPPVALRWVAKPPPRVVERVVLRRELGPTPRYQHVPRWGMPHTPVPRVSVPRPPTARQRMAALADTAGALLTGAAVVLALAAAAELWRYLLLLRSRSELLGATTVAISDAAVITTGVLSVLTVLFAMVVCTVWLVRARAAAAERIGRRDARSARSIALGIFVPGWNLVAPGVLLTELERDIDPDSHGPRPSRRLRWWWAGWVLSVALAAGAWLWRLRDSVQAQADGVLLVALSDVVAAAVVVLTLRLVREHTAALDPAAGSRRRRRTRWVASVPVEAAPAVATAPSAAVAPRTEAPAPGARTDTEPALAATGS
ncbi:DUF4328 domain-containing protein [Rhodococcus sp. X156]|uniref:DUF4328 domain-containing protein n=1 Tax=Rhodococcus sp. X156 TaxID=2499145 RepID=UPI000FDB1049|nr:DUF4328 domain-containing protein [Rhodococcus sp. X156]